MISSTPEMSSTAQLAQAQTETCTESNEPEANKVKSCYNPLRLGTVIVLASSGIDFVYTPRLYSDRVTR